MSRQIQGVREILSGPIGQFQRITKEVQTVQRGSLDAQECDPCYSPIFWVVYFIEEGVQFISRWRLGNLDAFHVVADVIIVFVPLHRDVTHRVANILKSMGNMELTNAAIDLPCMKVISSFVN